MSFSADFFLIFVQNLIFQHMIGLPGTFQARKHGGKLWQHGLMTVLFCTVCAGTTAMIRPYLPANYAKLLFPLCCVCIAGAMDLLLVLIARHSTLLNKILLPHLHNSAFSGAVLGAVLLSTEYTHEAAVAFRYSFRTGCGYLAACCMLQLAMPAFSSKKCPKLFRGWRGMYLYAGLLAMASACLFPV